MSAVVGQSGSKFRILGYGLPNLTRSSVLAMVGGRWNIEFYAVAGCTIDDDLEDSVKKKNKATYALLKSKYGSDWDARFYGEVDKEYDFQMEIADYVDSLGFIKKRGLVKFRPGEGYKMFPINDKKQYTVYIEGWAGDTGYTTEVYYTLLVDYKNKIVKILDYKTKPK